VPLLARRLAIALAVFLGSTAVVSAPAPDEAGSPAAGVSRLIQDIKASGVKKIAIVSVKGNLKEEDRLSLLDSGAEAGLAILLEEVDLAPADRLAASLAKVQASESEAVLPLGDSSAVQAILREMRKLGFSQPALVYETPDAWGARLIKKSLVPVMETVLDQKRPSGTDLISLKNGDKLTGTVIDATITVRTSYARELPLESGVIAGILFASDAFMDTIFTVNGNRFSGFIDDPSIDFELPSGAQVTIRREKVKKIIFRMREDELAGIDRNNVIVLANGDLATGVVRNKVLNVKTTYAKVPVDVGNVRIVTMTGGESTAVTVRLKGTEDQIQGILEDEDIEIDLDCGPVVKIYQDRIKEIRFQRGYGEALPEIAAGTAAGTAVQPKSSSPELATTVGPGIPLVLIPAGEFQMGSPESEVERFDDESPRHTVKIAKAFLLSATEITQAQYEKVMGSNPSSRKGPDLPVTDVSWDEAVSFCQVLTEQERKAGRLKPGEGFRLPTEAEWEYACRVGTRSRFSFGDDPGYRVLGQYAWFDENSGKMVHPVAAKKPNPWGLYDMCGNVWEWTSSLYIKYPYQAGDGREDPNAEGHRVVRGGSWAFAGRNCRSAYRNGRLPGEATNVCGLRISRTAP